MKKNYEINFENGTIELTKKFAAAASKVGTPEFSEMVSLRAAYPDYAIKYKEIEKKENKTKYEGLTLYKMEAFIRIKKKDEELKKFENFLSVYKNEKGKYATIKRAFLNEYKDEYNSLEEDDIIEIDKLAVELKNKAKAA